MVCIVKDIVESVLSKLLVFPVVMYRCESWTIKKAEHWRIDAFELWWWRRFLRVPFTARTSNQSILKEIRPEYSLEGLMMKLKLQYFGHLMPRTDSFGKDPDTGKDWRLENKGTTENEMVGWHHRLMDMNLSKLQELVTGREAWCAAVQQRVGHNWVTERNWIEWGRGRTELNGAEEELGLHGKINNGSGRTDQELTVWDSSLDMPSL